jgi:uncharacterized protein (DUF302 family)
MDWRGIGRRFAPPRILVGAAIHASLESRAQHKEEAMSTARTLCALTFAAMAATAANAAEGLIEIESPHRASETMDRLEQLVEERGLTVFARIDHAAGAQRIGASLRPTELLIFGNPQGGTPLMQCAQSVGIDLPLKALVWEDESSRVWLGYNDPGFFAARHGAADCPVVEDMQRALASLAQAATAP